MLWGMPAGAVTVSFTGNGSPGGFGKGIIGHDAVAAGSIAHMSGLYGIISIGSVYTTLTSPDAFDFSTGGELAIGGNLPTRAFAATALPSAALASVGISGALHIGLRGFTLNTSGDAGSLVDLSFSGLNESRIYRNGEALGFWEDECQNLQPGDVVVEIVPTSEGEHKGDGSGNGRAAQQESQF